MRSKPISSIHVGVMSQIKSHVEIKQRINSLVKNLSEEFADQSVKLQLCTDFNLSEKEPVLAILSSPVGNGRLLSGWTVDGGELVGLLVVQRSIRNESDEIVWQTVWDLKIPAYSPIYAGSDDHAEIVLPQHRFGHDYSTALFKICLAIMYAIVDGPQFE